MGLETNLVALRKQNGLTQMELTEKLNVSRQAISSWEVGSALPSTENLRALGKLYGVALDELMGGAPNIRDAVETPAEAAPLPGPKVRSRLILAFAAGVIPASFIVCTAFSAYLKKVREYREKPIPMSDLAVETGGDGYPSYNPW